MENKQLYDAENWAQQLEDANSINNALIKVIREAQNSTSHIKHKKYQFEEIMSKYREEFLSLGVKLSANNGGFICLDYKISLGHTISTINPKECGYPIEELLNKLEDRKAEIKNNWDQLYIPAKEKPKEIKKLMEHARIHRQTCQTMKTAINKETGKKTIKIEKDVKFSPMLAKILCLIQNQKTQKDWRDAKNYKEFWEIDSKDLNYEAVTEEMLYSSFVKMEKISGLKIGDQIKNILNSQITISIKTQKDKIVIHRTQLPHGSGVLIRNFYCNTKFKNNYDYDSDDYIRIPHGLPETIKEKCKGRLLDEIVDHPLTKNMGIKIIDSDEHKFRLDWDYLTLVIPMEIEETDKEAECIMYRKLPEEVKIKKVMI